jgi:Domain of unknown function (DUF4148)
MKSTLLSASVLALAAMAAGSSFAEGSDSLVQNNTGFVSTKTRADVQAELAQAQREGYNVSLGHNWDGGGKPVISTRSRDEVRREAIGSVASTNALERNYPVMR